MTGPIYQGWVKNDNYRVEHKNQRFVKEKKMANSSFPLRDRNGYEWKFDGLRVYMVKAERFPDNGYHCDTEDEAMEILVDSGYIDEETNDTP